MDETEGGSSFFDGVCLGAMLVVLLHIIVQYLA